MANSSSRNIGGVYLSIVNADITELLKSWNNIKSAITSIETTKASLARRYQQLGNDWKDKKYKELEDVVQECNKALTEILKILVKGEKFVGSLAKSLKEYEDTQIDSSAVEHSRNSFIDSLRSDTMVLKKTDAEKLQDFKICIAAIDEVIENYALSLESRGLQRGPVMNAILNQQRILQQAELLRNMNGDFSHPVPTLTPEDFDSIIDNCQNNGLLNYNTSSTEPRSLSSTRYGFTMQTINDTQMRVYNDPVGTNSLLIQQQGNSCYAMEGTCGLCQCSNLLTMAGVQGASEDSVISAAMHSSDDVLCCMDLFSSFTEERGGTTVQGRQEILSRCGLSTYSLPVSYNRQETIQRLSNEIRTGHGVIVSVDVARLWRNGQSGGHAISLISVTEDGNTFIYNDTGSGRMGTISSIELGLALTGRPANVTTNIIR